MCASDTLYICRGSAVSHSLSSHNKCCCLNFTGKGLLNTSHPITCPCLDSLCQVHGLPHQKRHNRGHASAHSAPSDRHTGPPTSHAEDPFHQLFRVFDVEQSAASCAVDGASGAQHPLGVPTPAQSGAGTQPGSVLLDEAYALSHFLPMVSGEKILTGALQRD